MMDTPEIEVPDTIPEHITRRHQRKARRTVHRRPRTSSLSARELQIVLLLTAALAIVGMSAGVVMLWMTHPSPTTFVAVPGVLTLMVYGVGVFAYQRRESFR